MKKDYHQLWADVNSATDTDKAARILVEITADKAGRAFTLTLALEDAKLCIEALDYGITKHNLKLAERNNSFTVLRRLAESHGLLPYRLTIREDMEVSKETAASGGFGDVRIGKYEGRRVAVKTARVTALDNLEKIKKQFYKEVLLWEPLSHPNILKLVGVQVDVAKGEFVTVSEWMEHGNVMDFIAKNHTNRLELLQGAAQGLQYLHDARLTHGDLKGANILMSNDTPPRPCLADFGFTTTVPAPDQQDSCSAQLEGGTTVFLSPELLTPDYFGRKNAVPTQEADIYAFGFVIFQILTGETPFKHLRTTFTRLESLTLALYVVQGMRPEKPADASKIGFSDLLWNFTQRCWDGKMASRPKVREVVTNLGEAVKNWDGLMPPHTRTESAASDPEKKCSGSTEYSEDLESSSIVPPQSPAEPRTTSGPSSIPSTPSSECAELSRGGSPEVVSTSFERLQLDSRVSMRPRPEEPYDG